jgi:hypothetical protein
VTRARRLPHALADLDYTLHARSRGIPILLAHDALAEASPNTWENHASWLCSELPISEIWRSLWRKRSYAHLPSQWRFFVRHHGWRGAVHVSWLVLKRVPITLLRCTTTLAWRRKRWGHRSRAWQEECRLRGALASPPPEAGRTEKR